MTDWNKILTPELIRKAAHGANLDQRKLVRKAKQLQTINLQLTMPKKEVSKFQKALKANKGMKICIFHKDNLHFSQFDFGRGELNKRLP